MTVHIRIIGVDGQGHDVAAEEEELLLDVAMAAGVAGIYGQCGGSLICATCHCLIPERWQPLLPRPHEDELELLSYLTNATGNSRLSCQIPITAAMADMEVTVPVEDDRADL